VRIRTGDLPSELPVEPGLYNESTTALLNVDGVARYLCCDAGELQVEVLAGVSHRNVRLFLLGSAFALLLQRRGLLPLHGNSMALGGRAFVFVGPSGSGKSTLAAWFHDRRHPLLADDVSVLSVSSEGRVEVQPGLPRFRLWEEAIARTGRSVNGLQHSYDEREPVAKFDVPARTLADAPLPLGGVLLLDRGERLTLAPLTGMEAVQTLFGNIYRGEYLVGAQHEALWHACVRVAQTIPVARWTRPWNIDRFDDDAFSLIADLEKWGTVARTPA